MAKIIIKNVGPIKKAELELNKINVFMGPQSSGKSTIAKLISYCQWVEKRRLLDGEYKEKVEKQLLKFHHLDENYFENNSFFEYDSEFVSIRYSGKGLTEEIIVKESKILDYKKSKNIYIPAERNFVSVVPNLGKYNETNDNIMNLIYDWFSAKQDIDKQHPISILNLDVDYYFQKGSDVDWLILKNENKEIKLINASSGLQSLIPLMVIINDLTYNLNSKETPLSVVEKEHKEYLMSFYTKQINESAKVKLDNGLKILTNRGFYHNSNLIIEEPEQNLFPNTQKDLIYEMLYTITNSVGNEPNTLSITTHSPYVLYALNNCMLAYIVGTKLQEYVSPNISRINPKDVSVYELRKENEESNKWVSKSIQQEDGLIGANYFDQNMKALMDDFYVFLKYYDDEE